MTHLELFAGVGGFRTAMNHIQQDLGMMNDVVGFSEIDSKATATYKANYDTANEIEMGDIVAFIKDENRFDNLPHFNLLTGGFPCQTFSMMGNQAGFNEDRGQMFFRIMDIVHAYHPNFILLENVKNLMNHDNKRTYRRIKEELETEHYIVHEDIFNTNDFGLPQKRNRVIVFARREELGDFEFSSDVVRRHFDGLNHDELSISTYTSTVEVLSQEVEGKYYLSDRIKPTILSNGSGNFVSNSDIDQVVARPLTASMHKMHRACQDNYYSDIFIRSHGADRPSERLNKEELANIPIRKLTPQEAFMLQGFPHDFALNAQRAGVANGSLYKQAGNAVSINTIYAVLHYLITNNIIFE